MLLNDLDHSIRAAMWSWYDMKQFIERSIFFSSDSMHVLTGLLVQLGMGALLKRPVSNWTPWLAVLVLACVNEAVDLVFDHWPTRALQYGESVKDLILTMMLPTLLLVAVRNAPGLFIARKRK